MKGLTMAVKPSPDRSDLESKTREDLQTIAKVKGVDISTRASKASLIEAIMGDPAPSCLSDESSSDQTSRALCSRRTVATPTDDFEDLLGEFIADPPVERTPAASDADVSTTESTPAPNTNGSERAQNPRQN